MAEGKPLVKDLDDVDTMNVFLAMIGGKQVPKDHFNRQPVIKSPPDAQDDATLYKSQPSSGENTNAAASPIKGTRAPPTTPASNATAVDKTNAMSLDPIDENDPIILTKLADPKSSLQDSMYANPGRRLYTNLPLLKPGQNLTAIHRSINQLATDRSFTRTKAQQDILDKIAIRESPSPPSNYAVDIKAPRQSRPTSSAFEDSVLAQFKEQAAEKERTKENLNETQNTEPFPSLDTSRDTSLDTSLSFEEHCEKIEIKPTTSTSAGNSLHIVNLTPKVDCLSPDATAFFHSSPTAVSSDEHKTDAEAVSAITTSIEKKASAMAPQSPQDVLDNAKAKLVIETGRLSISAKEPGSPETPAVLVTASEDPVGHEHATHFTSWGTAQARNTARARVRKVILRCLPATADLTLVQGLIHGGAIDTYALGVNGSASVTFTTPEGCDAYYTNYPNGLTFKFKGRSHVVYVEKGTDVDVISGILRGQLDCGASRCVRAIGADEDWGMKALIKLAEGKSRKGKVEHIGDVWRSEIRTIVFRFTSISDAVTFKAMLTRDDKWEACDIQFMDDPCEKAASVHLE